jgi:hypothetical protein
MTVHDASQNIIITLAARHNLDLSVDHGNVRLIITENSVTHPQEKDKGGSYYYFCNESHPYRSHTRSRAEPRKRDLGAATGHKSNMQTATT